MNGARRGANTPPTHPIAAAVHQLSPCTVHYAQGLTHPFSLRTPTCIPDLLSLPSKKVRVLTKGTFSTGVNGNGYILANPHTKSNNSHIAVATNSLYSGTMASAVSDAVGASLEAKFAAKIPYQNAAFGTSGVQGRVVAFGLRIRYTGPALYAAGQIIGFLHPDNRSLLGENGNSFVQYEQASSFPVNKEWTTCVYKPVKPGEYEYTSNAVADADNTQGYPMIFMIDGTYNAAGSVGPSSFEWQIIQFIEYIGSVDNITKSHSDIVGLSHLRNAEENVKATRHPHHSFYRKMSEIGKGIIKHSSPAIRESIEQSVTTRAINWIMKQGTSIVKNLKTIPKAIEAQAMPLLENIAKGGFFTALEEAAPLMLL